MDRKASGVALVFLLTLALGVQSAEQTWKKYKNARFGFLLVYPQSLVAGPEPINGGGREFHTPDREFSLAASAHFFAEDIRNTFEKSWIEELAMPDVTITYKAKADNWYVVSGVTRDGIEFYHRLYRKGGNWARFDVTYPRAKHKKYDLWVERIAKGFVPFLEGDFDRI
jgi:hypothetical protein